MFLSDSGENQVQSFVVSDGIFGDSNKNVHKCDPILFLYIFGIKNDRNQF